MNVFQAAKQVDCGEVMDMCGQAGRMTSNGRGKWVCPFHDDHEPSMLTYPAEPGNPSHYYCFTCQSHGDATSLYARLARTAPLDAARTLCKRFGLPYEDMRATEGYYTPPKSDDPRLAIVLAICGEWQRYRVKWYEEQLDACRKRLEGPMQADWAMEMERMWEGHYLQQLEKYKRMTEWEVLQDIRAEFEALGVNPYRRLRVSGTAT